MRVVCSKCGTELLGSVNRCWECGQDVPGRSASDDGPPVREGASKMDLSTFPLDALLADIDADVARMEEEKEAAANRKSLWKSWKAMEAKEKGAVASVVCGVVGLLLAIFSYFAIVFGLAGALLGFYGANSSRSRLATIGLVLSLLAFSGGLFQATLDVYAWRYGGSPFDRQVEAIIVE